MISSPPASQGRATIHIGDRSYSKLKSALGFNVISNNVCRLHRCMSCYIQMRHCRNCGRRHNMNDRCPAKGSKCRSCNKYNHWQSVCRQEKGSDTEDKRHQSTDRRRRKSRDRTPYRTHEDQGRGVNSISQATGQLTENFETMAFDNVKVGADNRDEVYATLNMELKN